MYLSKWHREQPRRGGRLRAVRAEEAVVRAVVYPANIGRTNNVRLYKFLTSSDGINYVRAGQWVSLSS